MAIRPIVPPKVELRCSKNSDGTYDAGSYDDGKVLQDPKYHVKRGTCLDIKRIHKHLRDAYPPDVPIVTFEACQGCLSEDSTAA